MSMFFDIPPALSYSYGSTSESKFPPHSIREGRNNVPLDQNCMEHGSCVDWTNRTFALSEAIRPTMFHNSAQF
jgi:hypothetical protein